VLAWRAIYNATTWLACRLRPGNGSIYFHQRAGWTCYTAAAAWAWRLGVEAILGLELCDGRLRITPCLPKSWGGCSAEITAPQGRIALRIEDPDGLGQGRSEMEIDGKPAQGNMVDFPTDGSVRQVWVRLRAARQSATQ